MDRGIGVSTYSGGKADERPLMLYLDDEAIEVEVIDKWVEEDYHTRKRKRHFKLRDLLGFVYHVYQEEETSVWFLRM